MEARLERGDAPCPPAEVLRAFLDERLPGEQADEIAHHLLSCQACADTVLGWETVEAEDASGEGVAGARPRRPHTWRWFALSGVAAAAALVLILVVPAVLEGPGFTAEITGVTGDVRGTVLKRDQAVEVRLFLPRPAHVYVLCVDRAGASLMFPQPGDKARLIGETVLPGGEEAWKLTGAEPGAYLLLVGANDRARTATQIADLTAALGGLGDSFSRERVREIALSSFDEVRLLTFTVVP
jgi:hypothetical protein